MTQNLTRTDKVVIVDDVMTTGGTKFEAIEKLQQAGAVPVGLIIAFDRAEPAEGSSLTATQSFEQQTGLPVFSLANIHDVANVRPDVKSALDAYMAQFA